MKRFLCFLSFFIFISTAQASVVVGGTRLIFDGGKKTANISVINKDKVTNIVQSWISVVDATTPSKDSFIITPPLFKLKAGEQGFVRIVRTGRPLPEDRESMFWLNVKGIPSTENAPDKNVVQFAINSRIKLIYRPAALQASMPENFASGLKWSMEGSNLQVKNDSALYMNFSQININEKAIAGAWFVAPYSILKIPVAGTALSSGKKEVTWSVINDYGMAGKKYSYIIQ